MKLHKDLDCYPQVWQDVATAYYVSSATSLRAQDAHVEQNPIAQRASFGNTLEARVVFIVQVSTTTTRTFTTAEAVMLQHGCSKIVAHSAQTSSSFRSNRENCQWTLLAENVNVQTCHIMFASGLWVLSCVLLRYEYCSMFCL